VNIRVAGTTVSVICEHCGSTLDATSPDLQVIARANEALKTPEIPLGTRGVIDDTTWEIVGYMERTDEDVGWAEYLLFNPYQGYAFLVDDGRRFSLGRLLDRLPAADWGTGIEADGINFAQFGQAYPVRVLFVVGEFYWRVAIGEAVSETDYVHPGTMLSCEDYAGERTWTRLDLLDWDQAEDAFGLARRRRDYACPAPHEPSPYRSWLTESWIVGIIAAITLLVVALMGTAQTVVASTDAEVVLDGAEKTVVMRNIDLPGARNRVSIDAAASALDNMWVDIDYSLTEQKTQDSVDAYGLAEFYEGSDEDGPWTEGDQRPDISLSSIPGGRYDLVITLQAHKWMGGTSSYAPIASEFSDNHSQYGAPTIPVKISVRRGGIDGGNVVLGLLLILAWPLIVVFLHLGFEKRRKAPITGSGDDD
jgi:hypothetical protein